MGNTGWRLLTRTIVFFSLTGSLLAQADRASSGPWFGVIINSVCTADEAFAESAKCTENRGPDKKLAFYNDTTRKIYSLQPQDQATGHLGDSVTVEGALQGDVIHVASIKMLTGIGLSAGEKAPAFSALDQFGRQQNLNSLRGKNGTVLLFFRSADWWPYCKGQLVELQSAKRRFEKQGISLAAISYDSVEILKYFADRRNIDFPLLSDPDSKAIQAYRVLNTEATGQFKGMARPGYFFIDTRGIVKEKFFEAKYRERLTGNGVIAKLFPELGEEVTGTIEAPHLKVAVGQSDRFGVPGSRVTVTAEVQLPPDVHVYAPGTKGYKTISLAIDSMPELDLSPPVYPRAKVLYLPAIKERVPVFEGTFHIRQDVKVSSASEFSGSLGADGKTVTIKGKLIYQACDSKVCYLPSSVPVQWQLQILPLDRQRAPENIRHQ
jgi:peroxiredoxin